MKKINTEFYKKPLRKLNDYIDMINDNKLAHNPLSDYVQRTYKFAQRQGKKIVNGNERGYKALSLALEKIEYNVKDLIKKHQQEKIIQIKVA